MLGNVYECTLEGSTKIKTDCGDYCAVLKKGTYQGNETYKECKAMDAKNGSTIVSFHKFVNRYSNFSLKFIKMKIRFSGLPCQRLKTREQNF